MEAIAHPQASSHHTAHGFVGVIYGDVGSTSFRCSVVGPIERNDFVQMQHETCGLVQIGRASCRERV